MIQNSNYLALPEVIEKCLTFEGHKKESLQMKETALHAFIGVWKAVISSATGSHLKDSGNCSVFNASYYLWLFPASLLFFRKR